MANQQRRPRPKRWTMASVKAMTYFRRDHVEQLLIFRSDYRRHLKDYGRKEADRYARRMAFSWLLHGAGVAAETALKIGKRLIIG